jgi:hypothetical protein
MTILLLNLALLLTASIAGAQQDERLEVELELFPMRFDNFFQAPDGAPQEDVDAARVAAGLSYRLHPDRPLRLTAEAGYTFYGQGLDDSPHVGVGLASEAGRREWAADLVWRADQPVFDVGDEFEQADILAVDADYGYRVSEDWELHGLGEWTRQEYDTVTSRDNDLWGLGGAVRYRGWGYGFSPEIGVLAGARDVEDPREDHDQQDVWLKVRSVPVRPLYLSLRYRVRMRDYDTGDPLASNFGREDDRDQWTLAATYRLTPRLSADLYVDYLDADSTKDSRVFETTLIGLGVSFDL